MRHDEGFFAAKDNLRLYRESMIPDAPRAHVAVVHGYMDHSGRYRELRDHLVADGFAAHLFDYRGHGQADGRRSHCDRFEDFLDDLDRFFIRVREKSGDRKTFLLGHSHGGLMSVLYAARAPQGLSGLILSAPYLKLAFAPPALKVLASRLIGSFIPWLPIRHELRPEDLTRDPERQRVVRSDPLYNRSVTPRWFSECQKAQAEAATLGPRIHVPAFVFGGTADPIAAPEAVRAFFESLASTDKEFRAYPNRVHEAMNDLGREEVLADISSWISAHL